MSDFNLERRAAELFPCGYSMERAWAIQLAHELKEATMTDLEQKARESKEAK